MDRFHEQRKRELWSDVIEVGELFDDGEHGRRNSVEAQSLLGPCLVEAQGERERIAAGVGNSVELADRRDVGLAVHAVGAFGDVEDDVGLCLAERLRKIFRRLEANDFSERGERRFNGGDGRGVVPLREFIAGDQLCDGEI